MNHVFRSPVTGNSINNKLTLLGLFVFSCLLAYFTGAISYPGFPYYADAIKSAPAKKTFFNKQKKRQVNNAAGCDVVYWAKWSQFTASSAIGTIDEGNGNSVDVKMTSNFDFSSTQGIYNYFVFAAYPVPIPNETVPKTTWAAGDGGSTEMTFSHPVINPVLLISSLGRSELEAQLYFSLPYVVLYDGGGMTYDNSRSITGAEGYAIIMFPGEFKNVTISSATPEDYTNITWGLSPPPFAVKITEAPPSCGSTTVTATGGVSYVWNGGDHPKSATNTFRTSGRYIVTVKNMAGCSTSVSKQIDVHTPPALTVAGDLTGCGSVKVTAFAKNALSYHWDGGETPNSATNTFTTSGMYKVTVTDAYQCQEFASRYINVKPAVVPALTITASPSGQVCAGTPVTYSASSLNGGNPPTYTWLKNGLLVASGPNYTSTDLASGDKIQCRLISREACAVPATVSSNILMPDVLETPKITFLESYVIDDHSPFIKLNPYISGNVVSYLWSPATGLSNPNIPNPVAQPYLTTNYTLTVVAANGCPTMATVKVSVLKDIIIPNVFSPNGDGINDQWNITNLAAYKNATVNIYNRYGTIIFHSIGYSYPWDGNSNGKMLPAGTYYYLIEPKDSIHKLMKGWVTILR